MKTLTIDWLNKCRCGNKLHSVKTARGNDTGLWDDDAVKCNSCGRGGVIQVCEGQARVLWETDEEMAEGKPMITITKEFTKDDLLEQIALATELRPRDGRDEVARRVYELVVKPLLRAREVRLPPTIWYDCDGESQEIAVLEKRLVEKALSDAGLKIAAAAGKGEDS